MADRLTAFANHALPQKNESPAGRKQWRGAIAGKNLPVTKVRDAD